MKKSVILMMSLLALTFGAASGYAHEEKDHHETKGHPRVKYAIRELKEAKEILVKLTPDADGHIAKASQSVDQAMQELSAVKEPVKS